MTAPPADHVARLPWWGRTWLRLSVSFLFVTTLPLVVTAIYTTRRHLEVVRDVAARAALDRVVSAARNLEDALHTAENDLLTLAEWPVLESYLASSDGADAAPTGLWRDKLDRQLRTFIELRPNYRSVTYTDESGCDRIRLIRRGTSSVDSADPDSPSQIGPDSLKAVHQLVPRQVLARLEARSQALVAMFVTRVPAIDGRPRGVVWLEVDCGPYVDQGGDSALALELSSFAPADDHAGIGAAAALGGQRFDVAGRLVSRVPVYPTWNRAGPAWWLTSREPASAIEAGANDFRRAFLGVLAATLLVATLLGILLARQYTRPVRELYEASRRIGRGDFDVRLSDTTGDEIGALAVQVGVMAEQLRAAHDEFERRLRETADQLVQAERLSTIGRTAAAVAHEINNPSGVISLYAQMLLERLPPDDRNADKLRLIEAKAREISRTVSDLLDYSRRAPPEMAWVETRRLLQGALDAALAVRTTDAGTDPLTCDVRVDAEAARLYVDPHQIERVFRNLAANACHAMPKGGRLTVHARRSGPDRVVVDVQDTGVGIPPEQQQRLFEPFFTTKRFGAGTGLGLAISKDIVERHGGRIAVQSCQGEGTTVSVVLPDGPAGWEI